MQTTQGQGQQAAIEADCPGGTFLLSGGADTSSSEATIQNSGPNGGHHNWLARFVVRADNATADLVTRDVYAICAKING